MNLPLELLSKHRADIQAAIAAYPTNTVLVVRDTRAFRLVGQSGAATLEQFKTQFQRELNASEVTHNRVLRRITILGRLAYVDPFDEIVALEVNSSDLEEQPGNDGTPQQT